ncbi:Protein T01D1.3 [Aphelenchoides avenae]|nr:Protein T01D1.3 [Aphelenchus avenae]
MTPERDRLVLALFFLSSIDLGAGLALTVGKSAETLACAIRPSLPYCRRAYGARTARQHQGSGHKDEIACRELREEYREACTRDARKQKEDEFCAAFENVCFQIPEGEPDQPIRPESDQPPDTGSKVPAF